MKKEFNDTVFKLTEHAKYRYTVRINASGLDLRTALEEAVPYTLDHGYSRAFVNRDAGVVFLVSGDRITTTIPAKELGFSDDDIRCGCGAFVQKSLDRPVSCKFCDEVIQ